MLAVTLTRRKQMSPIRGTIVLLSLCMLAFFGAPAQTSGQEPTKNPGMSTDKPAGSAPAAAKPAFDPALLEPATVKAKAPAELEVKFVTTAGVVARRVTRAWGRKGADSV